jgi:cell division protein FtsI (penicillin-binding protein 3)
MLREWDSSRSFLTGLRQWQVQCRQMQIRLLTCVVFFGTGFCTILGRLFYLMIWLNPQTLFDLGRLPDVMRVRRYDILDRQERVVATQLKTASVYANPKVIQDPRLACQQICSVLPHLNPQNLLKRLSSAQKGFVWLSRHVSPRVEQEIYNLGIPGVYIQQDWKRVYPYGELLCHILGYCDIDGQALGGVELSNDSLLKRQSVQISIDLTLQHIVFEVLQNALEEFEAVAANAIILDIKTGEILALVSLPGFNPNRPDLIRFDTLLNRNTMAANEPGSTFKVLNVAIALESGMARLTSQFDASAPFRIGRFLVTDFRGKNRILSLAESFVFSSNIASIKIAQTFGAHIQQQYMRKFGVLEPVKLEIPENGSPLIPKRWSEVTAMTLSYGYGLSVTPIQLLAIISGMVCGGRKPIPTLLKRETGVFQPTSIISEKTSFMLRKLLRLVALEGGSRKADVPGFGVFGKTGTAYQAQKGGYTQNKKRTNTFIGGFPYSNPRYMVLVMLNDPKATAHTYGFTAAGWNAAPVAGRIIQRVAPLLENSEDDSCYTDFKVPGWYQPILTHASENIIHSD